MSPRSRAASRLALACTATWLAACGPSEPPQAALPPAAEAPAFELVEATVADVHAAFARGELSCVALGQAYVDRINALDTASVTEAGGLPLNTIVQVNPSWRAQAEALDAAYAAGGLTGPLHCAPVLLKDLYDSFEFPTTAASLSLLGSQPPDDATSVRRLREAGALILAKAAMTEFAYFTQSYNSRTLRIATPYDTRRDAGGSSGGSAAAIAANFGLIGTGSDTCASIRLPPSNNSLVGVRASVGLVSQDGLVPLSHSQDVGGPITRSVRDAALMLDAMAAVDPADPMTLDPERAQPPTYTAFLRTDGLRGKRIGVLRSYGGNTTFGRDAAVDALIERAVADMAAQGATIVDPVDLPEFETVSVLIQEFPDHLDEYLASFDAPRANTVEVFLSGLVHPVIEAIIGVSLAARDTSSDSYFAKLERRAQMRQLVEAEMDRLALDALVYPPVGEPAQPTGQLQSSPCAFSATTSMPSIVVPAGFVDTAPPLPVGIEIFGRKWDESRLFEIAYAYEQATRHRAPPPGYGALAP
jgi:amidase